jgi:hypothetical protein
LALIQANFDAAETDACAQKCQVAAW